MAKDKKNGAEATINLQTVNEDNCLEQLENAGKFGEDIVTAAAEKEQEEKKAEKIREFNRIKDRAGYTKMAIVGRKRYSKDTDNILAKCVKELDEAYEKVAKGEMDADTYERELSRITDEQIKELNKARKSFDEYMEKLRRQFPNSWYDWDNPNRRISQALRNNA